MTRKTSIDAYIKIKEQGLLSLKRLEIYEAVYSYGPCTSSEAYKEIMKSKPKAATLTQSRARFTELREMGVLSELKSRKCGVTGHKAIVWAVTGDTPKKIIKKINNAKKIIILKKALESSFKLISKNDRLKIIQEMKNEHN